MKTVFCLEGVFSNYQLFFLSPSDTFNPQTVLSNTNNRLRLQASLTSLLQKDSITSGSIVEIASSTVKRRDISTQLNLTCRLTITNNKTCSTTTCLNKYRSHINRILTDPDQTPLMRYELSNSTFYWLSFRLPHTTSIGKNLFDRKSRAKSFLLLSLDVSYVNIDPKTIASLLSTLLSIEKTENQPSVESSTSSLIS